MKTQVKSKGWQKTRHAYINHKKVGVTILIPDKADFAAKKNTRNKKGAILPEDIILNVCEWA